jgi:uncharacterized protein YggU (UPF0235/DUF167 family)
MIINVRVIPNSSQQKIENFGGNRFLIKVTGEADKNEANIELINMLSKYFTTPVHKIKIKAGLTGRDKISEVG